MGTDYRFKIMKKDSNGKPTDVIAEFWYNRIKNVSNIYTRDLELAFDPEKFSGEDSARLPLTVEQLESDISKLKQHLDIAKEKLSKLEFQLLLVKEDKAWDRLKEEQRDLKEDIDDRIWAWLSLQQLLAVIETLVEDMYSKEDAEEENNKEYIWARDVLIFPIACW